MFRVQDCLGWHEDSLIRRDLRQFHEFFHFAGVCLWVPVGLRFVYPREIYPPIPQVPPSKPDSFRLADHPEGGQLSQYKRVCRYLSAETF